MFRNKNGEVKEDKVDSTLIFRSKWMERFKLVVALPDGIHLATISPTLSLWDVNSLKIWNRRTKKFFWEITLPLPVCAMTLLENELLIADIVGCIHRFSIVKNAPKRNGTFDTKLKEISALSALDDGSLAIAHGSNGSISIWELATKKEIKKFSVGTTKIHAMDTQREGLLLLGNESGCIFIYNTHNARCITHLLGRVGILNLVALPDNTIVFFDSHANLQHYDPTNSKTLSSQKIDAGLCLLIPMPNGWIGCVHKDHFSLYEPSWVRDYVTANSAEAKNAISAFLPETLTELVLAYAANTLFNQSKIPHKKEFVLTNNSPRLKGP